MAKEGIPILDLDHNLIGRYPYDYPQGIVGGKYPPGIIRIKAPPIRSGKNKHNGRDRLFAFDGECAEGVYMEARVEDFAL
jgi:hypothetical protein